MWAMQNMVASGQIDASSSCDFKTAYTQGAVARALGKLRKRKGQRVTAYHCRFCGHYHLTRVGGA